MANIKISELNELEKVDNDDWLVIVDVSTNETKKVKAMNVGTGGGGNSAPIGTIEAYSGNTAPNGYLLCDGSAVSRTTYSDLFDVIGTTYGTGDGSTTFNLPNIKGKVVVMLDSNDTDFDTLGKTGGSKYLQRHTHTAPKGARLVTNDGTMLAVQDFVVASDSTFTTSEAGTGDSGNLQPYIVLNYIIKANKISEVPTTAEVQNAYSTSQTDTYSCDYINNNDAYSTSEVKTNKRWIDGRPIYRRTITLEASTTTQSLAISTISNNISKIWIDFSNSFYGTGGIISDWEVSGGRFRAVIDGSNLYYICSDILYKNGTITFKYTKTTD